MVAVNYFYVFAFTFTSEQKNAVITNGWLDRISESLSKKTITEFRVDGDCSMKTDYSVTVDPCLPVLNAD